MATDWATTADFSFSDRDLWTSKIASADNTTDFKAVAEAPEDLHLLPTDFDILPMEVQVDNESWTPVTAQNTAVGSWTTTYSGRS